jgi:cytochrome c oxidase subunit II
LDLAPGIQSALHPRGPDAEAIAQLTWILFAGGTAILLAVLAIAAYAVWASPERRAWAAKQRVVIAGGIVFPIVVLTALLIYTVVVEASIGKRGGEPALRIAVIGHQWWWRVHYLDGQGALDFVTANEIRIPAGVPVELTLESVDVIHSFSVPNLAGKLDMIPGRANRLTVQAHTPGVFRGQCTEYCGGPHAKMAFYVVAEATGDFERWRTAQRSPASAAHDAVTAKGQGLFLSHCVACHTVRGTDAKGTLGPDLTHVGSRISIAAGILPNNRGTLAGWVSGSQDLKPGNLMPSMNIFSGEELRALAAYLESLR